MTQALRPATGPVPVPAHIAPYVAVLGQAEAVRFFLTFGGAELYLARSPKGRSRLEAEFGAEVATRLARVADEHLLPKRVPTAKPWIAAVWATEGLPHAEIARRLHIADKTVRAMLAKVAADTAPTPGDTRQLRLF